MPSWVVDARRGLPKFDSGEFVVGACFEDVLAHLGDCWDSGFVGAITQWFARNVEGTGLFYGILVNVFFPPPEWINFIDLGKGVG